MADNFGLKLGIDGEKEFKNALKDINSSFRVLGSEMKLVTSQFDKNDKSQEAVTARSKVLNKEIEEQKNKVSTLESALKNATDSFGENDKRTKNWAVQLNNAKADLNKLNGELDDNEKALEDNGKEFKDAQKKADNFGDELKDTSEDADKASSKFKSVGSVVKDIGKAMVASLAAVGTAVIGAGKKLTELASETASAGDTVDKQSQKMSMSAEEYQKLAYAAKLSGTNMSTMQKAQKQLMSSGSKLELVDALKQCANSADVAGTATEMFGSKTAQELLPMLNQGADGIDSMMNNAQKLGLVMSNDSVKASAKFEDSLSTLKETFSAVKNRIVSELLPGFTSIMDGLSGLLSGEEGAKEQIQNGAKELVDSLGNILPQIIDILITLIGAVAEIAPTLIDALVTGIVDNLPSIVESASNIIVSFLNSLISALPKITQGALQLVLTLTNGILDNLPSLIEVAIQTVVALALGIADALPKLIPTIIDAIILICETLINNIDKIIKAGYKILQGLISGIINALPKLIKALPKIITSIVTFITNNLPMIISQGVKLTVQLAKGLIQAIPTLVAQLPKIVSAIVSGLGKGLNPIKNLGQSLLEGLWNGIANVKDWLVDKIRSLGSTVTDALKSVFGIHSPSRVFRDEIGTNLALGLGVGFEDTMKQVSNKMKKQVPTSFDISTNLVGVKQVADDVSASAKSSSGISLVLNIDKFVNKGTQDLNKLADEISVAIASSIRRKGVAF